MEELAVARAQWADRDRPDTPPTYKAGARRATSTAVKAVDAVLRELHRLRSQTITETRLWDDAANARVDALLGRRSR